MTRPRNRRARPAEHAEPGGEGMSLQEMVRELYRAVLGNGKQRGLTHRVGRLETITKVLSGVLTLATIGFIAPAVKSHIDAARRDPAPKQERVIVVPRGLGHLSREQLRELVQRELEDDQRATQ